MIGRNVGAGEFDRAAKRGMRTTVIAVIATIIICLLTFLFIEPIMGIFTANREVIEISRGVFLVEILLETVRAINIILVGP